MYHSSALPGAGQALIELHRARLLAKVGSRAETAPLYATPSHPDRVAFFRREAEELYWNELTWEQITDEEAIAGGHLTELVFPGFLTLVDGLLPECGSPTPAHLPRPYPDAVEEILTFLGERCAELGAALEAGADSRKVLWARAMTLRLIDLVLYRLYRLSSRERERVETLE
jgi:hypothetical protein